MRKMYYPFLVLCCVGAMGGVAVGCTDGELRANADCSKFDRCVDSEWTTYTCPTGMLFDTSNNCYWESSVTCATISCTTGQKYRVSDDCYEYLVCDDGEYTLSSCGWWWTRWLIWFSEDSQKCTLRWAWKCPTTSSNSNDTTMSTTTYTTIVDTTTETSSSAATVTDSTSSEGITSEATTSPTSEVTNSATSTTSYTSTTTS